MTGIIFDIKRFAIHDGPGIHTTVFLKGCPMRCIWCHNPESWQPVPHTADKKIWLEGNLYSEKETIGREMSVQEVLDEIGKERLFMEESSGGVTFSGGEPLMQPLFLKELLSACHHSGFHTTVDTSGYARKCDFENILPFTDLFLYDLKLMDDTLHRQYTGVSNQVILENFIYIAESGTPVRVRIPALKGITATKENIESMILFLAPYTDKIKQIDLLPYHLIGKNKYEKLGILCEMPGDEARPEQSELDEIMRRFETEGFIVRKGG